MFPILLVCAPFLSLVGDRQRTFALLMDKLARAAPPEAFALIESVVRSVVFGRGAPGIISVGALLTVWMGSNAFSSLANALNRVSATHKTRPYWKTLLLSLGFVIVAGFTAFLATVVLLFGQPIVDAAGATLELPRTLQVAWVVGRCAVQVAPSRSSDRRPASPLHPCLD